MWTLGRQVAEASQPISPDCDFRAVYDGYHGFVWYTLHRLGIAPEAVEDAVQDVFVVAFRRRSTFEGPSAKAWLYGIARRVASNYRRSRRRRRERIRALGTASPRTATADAREAIETLNRYLAGLSVTDREIFVLAEVEGMTGPEISAAFGRNLQTTYTRMRKLRLGFRAALADPAAVKRDHPRASAGSWAALASVLSESPLVATGWTASLSSAWIAIGLGATVAVAGLVVVDRVLPDTAHIRRAGVVSKPDPRPRPADAGEDSQLAAPAPQQLSPTKPGLAAEEDSESAAEAMVRAPSHIVVSPTPTRERPGPRALAPENALLRDAASALGRGEFQEALEFTDRHAEQFSRSAFTDLRSAIRIQALCGLGKVVQARGEAALFLRHYPKSAAAVRVEKSCAGPS